MAAELTDVMKVFNDLSERAKGLPRKGCEWRAEQLRKAMEEARMNPKFLIIQHTGAGESLHSRSGQRWAYHCVCAAEDTVYDPALGVPMKKGDYESYMFPGESIVMIDGNSIY